MKKTFPFLAFGLVLLFNWSSCAVTPPLQTFYNWRGLATQPGDYYTPDYSHVLRVRITEAGAMDYLLLTQSGDTLVYPEENLSAYQRWALYWEDECERLWVDHQSEGAYVWEREGDVFVRHGDGDR
ncbi:MAG: hypothetical protein KDC54_21715 [Lewinella sp.]|nr:hypothetical protein [Lewinella sp.]